MKSCTTASRIVVMKDGRIVAERPAGGFTHASLVEAMGSTTRTGGRPRRQPRSAGGPVLHLAPPRGLPFRAAKGEVVGLAGLGGHGQTDMLLALFDHQSPQWLPRRDPAVTFVAGDRRENGIFDLWSILRNMTIAALADLSRAACCGMRPKPRGRRLAEDPHRHPHARHGQPHPVAVRRQPAEGAVRPRAGHPRARGADG